MYYNIYYTDNKTGATSQIDRVESIIKYTANDYYEGCIENADKEYIDMLNNGIITVIPDEE